MRGCSPSTRRDFLKLATISAAAATLPCIGAAQPPKPAANAPNIIIILADDIGYNDLSCYGSKVTKTPNLDRLAAEGMRFTDVHAPAAVCSATRYGLLTGTYNWRRRVPGILEPEAALSIRPGQSTIASVLRSAGYKTAVIGKWHLGLGDPKPDWNGELRPGPLEIGFDYFFGYPTTNDRVPCVFIENHRVVGLDPADPIRVSMTTPFPGEISAKDPDAKLKLKGNPQHSCVVVNGIGRIGYMTGGKAARFVDEDMADTLSAKAVKFIEDNKGRPFFLYFAPHEAHAPVWPNPRFRGTSRHGIRGDSIHELDWSVGQLLNALDRLNLADNALVIFSSDNGGNVGDGYEDPVALASGHSPNAPWRGAKYGLYEGGSRIPFLARWKGHVPAGKVSSEMFSHVDMLATCAALAGQAVPRDVADSFDVSPALLNEKCAKPVRDHILVGQAVNAVCIREGPWKFIPSRGSGELYNLTDDPQESKNLAESQTQVAARLRNRLAALKKAESSRPS